jgi:hypothetical protein
MEALCLNELRQVILCTFVHFFTEDHALADECSAVDPLDAQAIHLWHLVMFLLNTRQGLSCHCQPEIMMFEEEWCG